MENWQQSIKESLTKKRQEDLDVLIGELNNFPEMQDYQSKEEYQEQLFSMCNNKRIVYISSFKESTPLELESIPEHNLENLFAIWDIQRIIGSEFLDKYDEETKSVWNSKLLKV